MSEILSMYVKCLADCDMLQYFYVDIKEIC